MKPTEQRDEFFRPRDTLCCTLPRQREESRSVSCPCFVTTTYSSEHLHRPLSDMMAIGVCRPPQRLLTTLRTLVSTKRHSERRLLKYSAEKLYQVVADIENYKNFVPWCVDSVIMKRKGNELEAELSVGYSLFHERYTSLVSTQPPTRVTAISNQTNLFEFLRTDWEFHPARDGQSTWVTFQVEFQFKSALYNRISELFFQDIINHMVAAFEKRCKELYMRDARQRLH